MIKTRRFNICGQAVIREREKRGWSIYDLARRLDGAPISMDECQIWKIENAATPITDVELFFLAEAFNVTVSDLFFSVKADEAADVYHACSHSVWRRRLSPQNK